MMPVQNENHCTVEQVQQVFVHRHLAVSGYKVHFFTVYLMMNQMNFVVLYSV